jgi:hypothetical protein
MRLPSPLAIGPRVALDAGVSDQLDHSATGHEDRIQQELLGYLLDNPGAMDTLEGIVTWWLPRHEVRVGLERVAGAIERLEAKGLIERAGDPDRPLFRLRTIPVLTHGGDRGPSRA